MNLNAERKRCFDLIQNKIDIFDQIIGSGSVRLPVLVVLEAQRRILREVQGKILTS